MGPSSRAADKTRTRSCGSGRCCVSCPAADRVGSSTAWAPSGGRLVTLAGRTVCVWTSEGEALVETGPLASTVSALAWRADGTTVAASCYGGVYILPFVPGTKARRLAWKGSLISLAWSPDAKVIACGSQDGSVHFWRVATGQDSMMSGYAFKPKALAYVLDLEPYRRGLPRERQFMPPQIEDRETRGRHQSSLLATRARVFRIPRSQHNPSTSGIRCSRLISVSPLLHDPFIDMHGVPT
jgi:WD40 repeat protein